MPRETNIADENIIGAPKMQIDYGAIQLLFFPIVWYGKEDMYQYSKLSINIQKVKQRDKKQKNFCCKVGKAISKGRALAK